MPGFPRNTQSLGASRRKAVSRYPCATSARSDIIAAEVVEDLQAALAQFAEIASDLKTLTQKALQLNLTGLTSQVTMASVLTVETNANPETSEG